MREPALVPRVFQQAFHLMRSGRPGPVLIDLPFDVQMAEIEFDIDTYEPLPVYKPAATREQIEKALDMLNAAERPLIVAGGGIINADASDLLVEFAELTGVPVIPTLMGWGTIPDDHPLMAGMVRPADQPPLRQRHHAGERLRARHRQPLGQPPHRLARGLHARAARSCTSTSSRRRSAASSRPTSASSPTPRPRSSCSSQVATRDARPPASCRTAATGSSDCRERKRTMQRKTHFDDVPIKPQRVYEEMNKVFGARHLLRHAPSACRRSPAAQFLHVYEPRHWINCGQAGPLGWTMPAALGVRGGRPDAHDRRRCRATTTSSS